MTPDPDIRARNRFLVLSLLRIGGVVMVMVGLLAAVGRVQSVPVVAGYALIVAGFIDLAIVPRFLARRWRTPPPE